MTNLGLRGYDSKEVRPAAVHRRVDRRFFVSAVRFMARQKGFIYNLWL